MGQLGTLSFKRLDTGETRVYPSDTSFEPYRREALRRRTIESQRESINLTNIPGEGTLATEGLWRREMVEWSMGAGQYSLDRKGDDLPNRFLKSKGVDVFTYPQRATLLPATTQRVNISDSDVLMSRCGPYLVVAASGTVKAYNSSWSVIQTYGVGTDYGGSAWSTVYSICSNDTYCYIATDTGLWFALIGTDTDFQLYAAPDTESPYTTGYTMVRWCNDQLITSCGARLYAFQPRSASGANNGNAPFGSPPSIITPGVSGTVINEINNSAGVATAVTNAPHGLVAGQQLSIAGSNGFASVNGTPTLASGVLTIDTPTDHGFVTSQKVQVDLYFYGAPGGRSQTVMIESVPSATSFTYHTTKIGAAIIATGFTYGTINAVGSTAGYGYNGNWTVLAVPTITSFTFDAANATYGTVSVGGTISFPSNENGTYAPDVLVTHENPNWVWSDATGGQTQVYFGGYVLNDTVAHSGAILRSDLLGSSTSSTDGLQTIASSSVAQPWMLDTPVQCLPMSPDEYPMCVQSYLNYIFVGTNRGIRMCQTLSIYDPTATATGDLKAGALIPNLLQPVTMPVTAIVGDGRFVWFAWNNYDGESTGLGKLDLSTFLPEDPLAPVYASDLMVTGQGVINSLDWDPNNNVPLLAVSGLGIWGADATNEGGNVVANTYVESGTLVSSYYDFGIAENKIPVFFDYGVYIPTDTEMAATVVMDPLSPSPVTLTPTAYTSSSQNPEQNILQTGGSSDRGYQFQTTITLSTSNSSVTPTMYRWTMKAWPTPVQGTLISAVLNVTTDSIIDGQKHNFDPEAEWAWLEGIRWDSVMVQYADGAQTTVIGVIDAIDDIPHKARGRTPGGHEGDFVVSIKTLTPFVFTPWVTS